MISPIIKHKINNAANNHATSPESLTKAWKFLANDNDICYVETADNILYTLGVMADVFDIHGEEAAKALRVFWNFLPFCIPLRENIDRIKTSGTVYKAMLDIIKAGKEE